VPAVQLPPPPTLTDGVVALRPLEERDAEPFASAFRDDPHLAGAIGVEEEPTEELLRERFAADAHTPPAGAIQLAVADATTDAFLGTVILHSYNGRHGRIEVGFWLARDARGRGLGSRAVTLAVSWAFETLGVARVEMTTLPDNPGALALAASLGFTREGVMRQRNFERGRRVDVVMLGVLRDEWE
jgi:RimJ/RimL family protein N-acetyltransferase